MNYSGRQKKLAAGLRAAGIDTLLVTQLPNIRYLCGFTGSSGVLIIRAGERSAKATLFTDGRYTQQAAEEVRDARITITSKPALMEAAAKVARSNAKAVGFEAQLPYASYKQVKQVLRGRSRLKPLNDAIEQLRVNKDVEEIEQLRASAVLAASLLQTALATIRPGVAESMVAGEMELQARRAGAEKMSFDTIVAGGVRSALPHGRASSQPIPGSGFIILDWGVILAGYCSDLTRTVHVGPVSTSRRKMYQAVKEAQSASVAAVGPGVSAGEVDQAGREVLSKAGFARYFTHSTGHGVGLEVHEAPRLAKGQKQKLTPGMVVTVEPGIYIPEEGGVRIEDMVLVTETGREVLTPATKDLITL
jgi:Xaa-Pro aminopeptidase